MGIARSVVKNYIIQCIIICAIIVGRRNGESKTKFSKMDKNRKVLWFVGIAVTLDIIMTYIFLQYFPKLIEGNQVIQSLSTLHHLLIFAYIPFIVLLCEALMHWCKKIGFVIESRTVVLLVGLKFAWAVVYNIMLMVLNL